MKASEILASMAKEEEGRGAITPNTHASVAIYRVGAVLAAMFERASSSVCGTPIGGVHVCPREKGHVGECRGWQV